MAIKEKISVQTAHAGKSYPAIADDLRLQVKEAVEFILSENILPSAATKPVGWIIPHIDLRVDFSHHAMILADIVRSGHFPEVWWILGVGHQCPAEFSILRGEWLSPLGAVPTADEHLDALASRCSFPLYRHPETFEGEHSIEFPVVLLSALRDLYFPQRPLRVVPVLTGGLWKNILSARLPHPRSQSHRLGRAIAEILTSAPPQGLLASIDGCHVGPRFDHPFTINAKRQKDIEAWENILWQYAGAGDFPAFFTHLSTIQNQFYFDGVGAMTILLQNCHMRSSVLSRATWYEPSDQSMVSFTAARLVNSPGDC